MSSTRPLGQVRYAVAVVGAAAGILIHLTLGSSFQATFPYLALFPMVAAVAWFGGFRPGIVTAILGYLGVRYLAGDGSLIPTPEVPVLLGYLVVSTIILTLGEQLHRARTAAVRQGSDLRGSHFKLLIEGTKDFAIFMLDPKGFVSSWNPGAEAIKGYRAEEIIGQHFSRFYPPESIEKGFPERGLEIAAREGRYAEEGWRLRKDGSRFWASVVITALKDDTGRLLGFSKITADRTLAKQAEETAQRLSAEQATRLEVERASTAIQAERELLRVTIQSIGDAVITTDVTGKVTLLNAIAAGLTGWPTDEAVGQPLGAIFKIIDEETRQPLDNPAERVLREGTVIGLSNHTLLVARDGTERPIDDSAAPIRDANGRLLGVVLVFRDISERRRTASSLRETEARKAAVMDTALDGIISMDHRGIVLEFNGAAERIFGYSRSEILGRELVSFLIPPRFRDGFRRQIARFSATGDAPVLNRRTEMTALRADGKEFPIELSVIRITTGRVPVFTAYVRDITDRVRAERRRGARLAVAQVLATAASIEIAGPAILSALGDGLGWDVAGLWLVDAHDQVLRSAAFWRAPDIVAENFEKVSRSASFARGVGLPGRVWRDGVPTWVADVTQDGNFPRARIAASDGLHGAFAFPIGRNEDAIGVMEFFSGEVREPDVDLLEMVTTMSDQIARFMERRRAEQAAQFLADASATIAVLADSEASLQRVVTLAVPLFADYCSAELMNRDGSLRQIALARNERMPDEETIRRNPFAGRGPIANWKMLQSATSELHESAMRVPIPIRGKAIGAITFITAEPGRRYGPNDLAFAEDVAARVGIAIENANLYLELRDADRKKDEFLAILSHELRNPLAPLGYSLELLKRGAGNPNVVAQSIDMMQRQLGQLVRLVDDLLDVNRISRDVLDLRKDQVELAVVIRSAIETSRPLIEQHRHRLNVSLPREPLWLNGDLTRLAQVFANLLNNAAKYTNRGGEIWLTAERRDQEVIVKVRDNGIGIPPDKLPDIFAMFSQVDRSIERAQGGLGIGLSLVKRLVELHGGSVAARSEGIGKGSEFEVRLPIATPTAAAATGTVVGDGGLKKRHRILVVDDNPDSVNSLAAVLQLMGNETQTATDGEAAIEAAENFRPDIIFLDIGLPKLNGYDVCRLIRQKPWGRDALMVALTGWGQAEDKRRSEEAGFNFHLVKPASSADLQRVLAPAPSREQPAAKR